MRKTARSIDAFLQATKTAYAETLDNYIAGAVKTAKGRIGFAVVILVIAMSTGFRIIGAAFVEPQPVARVLAVWAAALWLFGFGYSAGLILKPVLQRTKR